MSRATTWVEKLDSISRTSNSLLCIGLDPDPKKMPVRDVREFNRTIVDATRDLVCAYKPNLAFYEAAGLDGLAALQDTIRHIRKIAPDVVLVGDAKRGDIPNSARAYAAAMFDVWDFDAVTVSPYLGGDSLEPFLERPERGAIVLCKNSNPGSADLQDLEIASSGRTLFEHVGDMVERLNTRGNAGMFVGATYPDQLRTMRRQHPLLPLLVAGVGAQGGDPAEVAQAGANQDGRGVMINASRSVIYASNDAKEYADAARSAAERLRVAFASAVATRANSSQR